MEYLESDLGIFTRFQTNRSVVNTIRPGAYIEQTAICIGGAPGAIYYDSTERINDRQTTRSPCFGGREAKYMVGRVGTGGETNRCRRFVQAHVALFKL